MVAVPALALLVAFVIAGCGDDERPVEPGGQSGRLVVEKSLADGPVFIEGSLTQLRVVGEDGAHIVDGLRPVATLDLPLFDRPVPEGTYELTAVERPCDGNCGFLDPPVADTRCHLQVVVRAGRTTRVALALRASPEGAAVDCSAAP